MRKAPSTFRPHARYALEERAFRCLVCERENVKPDIDWDPCKIRTHLKEKHGIGIRSQGIEHWTKEFQIEHTEYVREKLKKNKKQIEIKDVEVVVQGRKTQEKKKNEKNEERRILQEQKTRRDSW
jgi:hypothetical protein